MANDDVDLRDQWTATLAGHLEGQHLADERQERAGILLRLCFEVINALLRGMVHAS